MINCLSDKSWILKYNSTFLPKLCYSSFIQSLTKEVSMVTFLQPLIHQGTQASYNDSFNRRLIYTNIIYITLPFVYTLFVIIDIEAYLRPIQELKWDQFIFLFEIAICFLALYLNKKGKSRIGRLIFIITWPLLMHIIPIWYQQTPPDYYLAYPVGLIFHALLIHLMFSRRTEPAYFWTLFLFNFILVLTSIQFLISQDDEISTELLSVVNNKYFFLVVILYYLLFSLLIFLLMQSVENLFSELSQANRVIQEQKEEVTAINEELVQSNNALTKLNDEVKSLNHNLETIIQKRTQELAQKNERLTEYAFYNAHKLRAPYCRIKGLFQLKSISKPEEQHQLNLMIQQELDDLDLIIKEIQKIVSE